MTKLFSNKTRLKPLIAREVSDFLNQLPNLFPFDELRQGPIHIVFPQVMRKQIAGIKNTFKSKDIDVSLFFAHKPTKSSALIKLAIDEGIGIDVASLPELEHVLRQGCLADRIEATGPKNQEYLKACLQKNVLISVDSFAELQQIALLKEQMEPRVLLRIADPVCADRNKQIRVSRFGLPRNSIEQALHFANENNIAVLGFHFHNDEREADVKAGYIQDLLSFIEMAHQIGHRPSIINIGGGLRDVELENYSQWQEFLNNLEQELLSGKQDSTWRSFAYGMYINDKGRVSGRERIQGKFTNQTVNEVISRTFDFVTSHGVSLHQLINDTFLTVMAEPGYFLTQGAGISLVKVVGVAQNPDGSKRLLVDANMYNLSVQRRELLTDPILLSPSNQDGDHTDRWTGFIMGNLCLEEDLLMRRSVSFDRVPVEGDYICFLNTAGYTSFENAEPHMHSTGTTYVAFKQDNNWQITEDL